MVLKWFLLCHFRMVDKPFLKGVPQYTNRFVYDGWNLIAEVGTSGSLIRSYVWGLDLSGSQQGAGGVGGLLEISYYGPQTTNCFVAYDGNGNIAALVNAGDGTVVANYEYGPFGEPIRITGLMAKVNPFRFSTKYQDDESDLLYYGYRYYKPSTGTWPNRDPMDELGGANLYAFVGNAPLTYYDWLGLCSKLNCHNFSEKLQTQDYALLGLTLTLEASWQKCSCCGCSGDAIDAGVSFSWQVGIGFGWRQTIGGYTLGLDIVGPQVGDATELHYVKECGEEKGAVHFDKSTGAFLSGEIGGGIGIVGLSGSYGGHYYAEYGIEADSTGADAYITFGYDVTAKGTLYVGAVNYTFTHYFSEGGTPHKTPRLSW